MTRRQADGQSFVVLYSLYQREEIYLNLMRLPPSDIAKRAKNLIHKETEK